MTHPATIDDLVALVASYDPQADFDRIRYAYAFADEAHGEQRRASGERYIVHPLATAIKLAQMRLPPDMVIAGLLHDVPEDTTRTLEEIEAEFGADVAGIVGGITKLGKIKYRGVERYIENLRKMFLAMAEDARVVIVKFADRLHNLQTLDAIPPEKRQRIALESLEIFAPIANRLGMGEMKGELEDAAFKHALPKEYAWTKSIADHEVGSHEGYIERVMGLLRDMLAEAQMPAAEVHGRMKHLYSLYLKLLKNDRNLARIYDIVALRVIVPSIADCYAALGVIHGRWTPLKGRIKDYIAQPKPNGYRSLHTTVFCEDGEIVEFQIRTPEMHDHAEFGVAAHWSYDEGKKPASGHASIPHIPWMSQLAEIQKDIPDQKQYLKHLEEIKIDVFKNRIFVFTPKGDVIDLPEESTPIDLAYAIHTDIGNTCVAAKINDQLQPLSTPLRSGDMVEIVTDKGRKGPSADWVDFAKTRLAKSKIRAHARADLANWIRGLVPRGIRRNQT